MCHINISYVTFLLNPLYPSYLLCLRHYLVGYPLLLDPNKRVPWPLFIVQLGSGSVSSFVKIQILYSLSSDVKVSELPWFSISRLITFSSRRSQKTALTFNCQLLQESSPGEEFFGTLVKKSEPFTPISVQKKSEKSPK